MTKISPPHRRFPIEDRSSNGNALFLFKHIQNTFHFDRSHRLFSTDLNSIKFPFNHSIHFILIFLRLSCGVTLKNSFFFHMNSMTYFNTNHNTLCQISRCVKSSILPYDDNKLHKLGPEIHFTLVTCSPQFFSSFYVKFKRFISRELTTTKERSIGLSVTLIKAQTTQA